MRFEAEVEGDKMVLDLEEQGCNVTATVGERRREFQLAEPGPGLYLLSCDPGVFEARVWRMPSGGFSVDIGGRIISVQIADSKHRRPNAEHTDRGRFVLTSPMPGKVVRVLVVEGQQVTAGQGVVVVEAMKMQNELKSAKSGRVAEVCVRTGATVAANQVLAIIE